MTQTDLHPATSTPSTHRPEAGGSASSGTNGDAHASKVGETHRRPQDKVRIYDLARELGRDNRELLETCDRLGISYKSHSSTISAEEAERVRHDLVGGTEQAAAPVPSKAPNKLGKPKPRADRSQPKQILNVRPPTQERDSAPQPPESPQPPVSPEHAPARPSYAAATSSKPTLVGPPQRPASSPEEEGSDQEADVNEIQAPEPQPPEPHPVHVQEEEASLSTPSQEGSSEEEASATAAKPELIRPPSRRSSSSAVPAPASAGEKSSPEKPVAKAPEKGPEKPVEKSAEAPVQPAVKKPNLQRPKPPSKPVEPPRPVPAEATPATPTKPQAIEEPVKRSEVERPVPAPSPRSRVGTEAPRPKPAVAKPQKPQLVGAPVRPGSRTKPEPKSAEVKARGEGSAGEAPSTLEKPRPPQRAKPELVGPPVRQAAKPEREQTDPTQAPARPGSGLGTKVRRREREEEEDDEKLNALNKQRTPGRSQTKRKRRRGGEDGEVEGVELEVVSSVVAAKQAEINALKPLPRPASKPTSTSPAASHPSPPTARPRPASSGQPKLRRQEVETSEVAEKPTTVELNPSLTVKDLADRMQVSPTEIIKVLFLKGLMVNINQILDMSTMESVATELGFTFTHEAQESQAKKTEMLDLEDIEHLVLRPPVVTIMGHVDHGKTTLLDAIRDANVVSGEAGGITQRIGAYHVDVELEGDTRRVVFLDTPGHEAFTAMRARGAKVTDLAVLVVAADDGVQPQTLEAISHARAAEVPIIVAINKVDKPDSQPDRIKQQLSEHGLVPEEWGGDIPMVEVSALAHLNLDALLEMILLVAEIGELQANPNRLAKGTVVEANLDKARGPVATLLIQNGTLKVGDPLVAGSVFGRVKAMMDDRGQRLEEAGPSSAVQLLGLSDVPTAGDEFTVFAEEREARRVADTRTEEQREARLQQLLARRVSLGTVSAHAQEGRLKDLNLIIKTDVQGSAEAILASLQQLAQEEVQLRVLLSAPGEVTETDVDLAAASEAIIVGFNTSIAPGALQVADRYGVDIREYDIIYNLLDDITAAMEGLLEPEQVEESLGQVEVRQVIPIGKGMVAGCYVQSGKVVRNAMLRVRRQGELVYEGRVDSLKRFKEDTREVAAGFECGIGVDRFNSWVIGDILEIYQLVLKRRTLSTADAASRRN